MSYLNRVWAMYVKRLICCCFFKIPSWSGSIEVGVLLCDDPSRLELPGSATELTSGAWVLSGTTLLHNGVPIRREPHGWDLDQLGENDVVGIMRTDKVRLISLI